MARAASQAVSFLGSLDKARPWLKTPNRTLVRERSLDLLETEIGAWQVNDVLLHLNDGFLASAPLSTGQLHCRRTAWIRLAKERAQGGL